MVERHETQGLVLRFGPLVIADILGSEENVLVGQLGSFRGTGGSAGVEDDTWVVGIGRSRNYLGRDPGGR